MVVSKHFSTPVKIYETIDCIFYRSRKEITQEPVILKQIKAYEHSGEQMACFDQEIKAAEGLEHDGVLRLYEIMYINESPMLVMEDFGGELLSSFLSNQRLNMELFLKIAVNLTNTIVFMHESGFVHFRLNPQNIWVNLQRAEVKITGFKAVKEKSCVSFNGNTVQNSLYEAAYISPEQTGRISRKPDHRSDLYALGIIFYELLTRMPPFQSEDYAELIHSHLARKAVPVCKVDNHIPCVLSDMVDRLMEKRIDSRYQTAQGLLKDLEYCQAELSHQDGHWQIPQFSLRRWDFTGELHSSAILLGRDAETARLLDAFEQVKKGEPVFVLVTGYSGVGKTSLVNEIVEPVILKGGVFLQGKFDQYKRVTPYEAFAQAFEGLFQDILTRSKGEILVWRERILQALSDSAGIITDIFPGLSKIIGPQAAVEPLPFSEAQNRFNLTMVRFLKVLACEKTPLVLFLDDLQWADIGSISILELIFSGFKKMPLYVIGAYRNNETSAVHPLRRLITRLSEKDRHVEEITLEPLGLEHVRRLLTDGMFGGASDPGKMDALAELCYAKAGGNPFFLHYFIRLLRDEGLIAYHLEGRGWEINLEEIIRLDVTDNVAELMIKKIGRLSPDTIDVLKLAACLNNTFDPVTLSGCMKTSREAVAYALAEAVAEGLVLTQPEDGNEVVIYRFLHDRVQQAFYSLTNEKQRQEFHYRIGCFFQEQLQETEKGEQLLGITDNFNLAEDIIRAENKILLLTQLNLEAGKKARSLSAHEQALAYFRKGITLLEQNSWNTQYVLTLELYTGGIGAAYVCAEYGEMEQLSNVALKNAQSLSDRAKIYEVKIEYLTATNRLKEANDLAREILESLGERIPGKSSQWYLILETMKLRRELSRHSLSDLAEMREMSDEKQLTIMRLINSTGLGGYTFDAPLLGILALKAIRISLRHGIAPITPAAFASYGHILCVYFKKREEGYQYGKLAMTLQDGMKSKMLECKTRLVFEILIRHNREPLANTLRGFPNNHKSGMGAGDLMSAGHIMLQYYAYLYMVGTDLAVMQKQAEAFWDDLMRTGNRTAIGASGMFIQGALNLIQSSQQPWIFAGVYFNEEEALPRYTETNDHTVVFCTHFNKMIIAFLWRDDDKAMENFKIAGEYRNGAVGTYCIPVFCFYGALLYIRRLDKTRGLEYLRCKRKFMTLLKEVKSFAEDAPQNNLHKYLIIRAEYARVCGKNSLAPDYYREAVMMAGKNGFIQEEGLANELAAEYYLAAGDVLQAGKQAEAAISCYLKWGCIPKVNKLREVWQREAMEEAAATMGTNTSAPPLDVETIVKASQAISEEIVLHELLKKMIYIMLRYAGARRALFIMERDGEFYIEAEGSADNQQVKVMNGAVVRNNPAVMERLINYVANTRERVLLGSAAELVRFADGAVLPHDPRSLLCLPVESVRGLVGILYLENDLMDGAFTEQHLLILKVLTSQLAISMENARLYQNMEKMVEKRTEELQYKNEALKHANQKLKEASLAKNSFLASISHEMRTPLHGVMGMAGLLEKSGLNEQQSELVTSIQSSAHSLMEIINEILDLSKLVAGRLELEEKEIDVNLLVREFLPTFVLCAKDKGITLTHKIHQSCDKCLKGDSLRIRQIITNLLSNAVKFTEGGKVELEVSVQEKGEGALMEIVVCDTGIGIPADKLEAIFGDFTQVDSGIFRTFGGTGLGLSIAKRLAEQMKGDIGVQSELGRGSIFRCRLYLNCAQRSETTTLQAGNCKNDVVREIVHLRVLAAEDNSINQKYIRMLLKYLGCAVDMAADGTEVLEMLKQESYDCILMDKNMPNMDGVETTRRIRQEEKKKGGHIPIIALTAAAIEGDRKKLLSEGMDYYLSKPLDEAELYHILKKVETMGGTYHKGIKEEPDTAKTSDLIDQKTFIEEAEAYGRDVMADIIAEFFMNYPQFLENIEAALAQGDPMASQKALHQFAGTVSVFYCRDFTALLRKLERDTEGHDLSQIKQSLPEIKKHLNILLRELASLRMRLSDLE